MAASASNTIPLQPTNSSSSPPINPVSLSALEPQQQSQPPPDVTAVQSNEDSPHSPPRKRRRG